MGLHDFSLYDVIVRNAEISGGRPAWQDPDHEAPRTFADIKRQVDQLARALKGLGCQKGDRIGIIGKNCLPFFVVYGAAAALGAIVLPVNWRLSADEAAYVLDDAAPRWVFADNDNPRWVGDVRRKISKEMRFFNLLPQNGVFDDIDTGATGAKDFHPEAVGAHDGFVIIHTAAVSGYPRGALLSHGNLLCAHMHLMHCFGLTPTDVHINALPMFHVAGLFMAFSAFHAGVLNVNLPKFDAARIVRRIAEGRATFMFTFAPMLKSILDEQAQTNADIRALRAVMGLEAPEVIERYQNVTGGTFHTMYGQTETSLLVSAGPYNDCPGAAGRPVQMATVRLMDDDNQPVPRGEVGEIAMRGPMVFKGYWNLAADNAKTFRSGWHHTGDLGRLDQNGYLWYTGRKPDKELIKPGGENVYPAEVEKTILAHPDVEAVVVFGVPDPKWKEGIKAVCVLSEGKTLEPQALIDFVGERIARYKKPQYVTFVQSLPRNADGTVDRQAVKKIYAA